jgi:predicted DNA-binding transcriptional regulator AlpA
MKEHERKPILVTDDDRLLRARDLQQRLGVSRATAYRMMTDGALPVVRFGDGRNRRKLVRVILRDLTEWIATNRQTVA